MATQAQTTEKEEKERLLSMTRILTKPKAVKELIEQYGSISAAIRSLHAQGKTRGEIAEIVGIDYRIVRNVLLDVPDTLL